MTKQDQKMLESTATLELLFWPRSIAVIGASSDSRSIRGKLIHFLQRYAYSGKIFPVSASHREVLGLQAYASVRDLPERVDLAIVAVRAEFVMSVLKECAQAGVKFAICLTSGFGEESEAGKQVEREMARLASETGMRVIGPNTGGMFNVAGSIPASFGRTIDLDGALRGIGKPRAGPLGIVSQSGGLAAAIMHRGQIQHGLGFSYFIASGNEADLGLIDFASYMVGDERTKVIALIVEGLHDGMTFMNLASAAADKGKPIIVLKMGNSDAGLRAAISHTARLTGSDAAYDAVFRRYGVVRARDEQEMVDSADVFSRLPIAGGKRVGILTTSGGAGVLLADACEAAGLDVPMLDDETQKRLMALLPSFGSTSNPIDLTAQVTLNPTEGGITALSQVLEVVLQSPLIDSVVLSLNLAGGETLYREKEALSQVVRRSTKPVIFYSHSVPPDKTLEMIWDLGATFLPSTTRVARGLGALANYGLFLRAWANRRGRDGENSAIVRAPVALEARAYSEYDSQKLLESFGIRFAQRMLATSADEAVRFAQSIGFPVALKIQSPAIPHKSEVGGIRLDIESPEDTRMAFDEIMAAVRAELRDVVIEGVLVQKMAPRGRELVAGIVRDRDFGLLVMLGLGGLMVEILRDVTFEPLPLSRERALDMIKRLRGAAILGEFRGASPVDIHALADVLLGLASFAEATGDTLAEVDLNPVIAYPTGVLVVDALVVPRTDTARTA
jgi:acyl-CoA synthetase (NDP forming)